MKAKVYRVRNIPGQVDSDSARALIAESLEGLGVEHVVVWSLASTKITIPGEKLPRKVATVTFKNTPAIVNEQAEKSEWRTRPPQSLILDSHFRGITPLNDVDPVDHEYDCVAISGLSSHPFGSWQPRGGDKSFMWIRDTLPKRLLSIRCFLHGYDTNVVESTSKQTIGDLSTSLINTLEANGWAAPSAKPLVFLAHSLGGVILKQALILLANAGAREPFLLGQVLGCIFFGVPSRGMPLGHVLHLIKGKPNEGLVHALSDGSDYVAALDQQFRGITHYSRLRLVWAFETKETPTVVTNLAHYKKRTWSQAISKSGPSVVLVPRDSAAHSASATSTIQINEDHSSMVKFSDGDSDLDIIIKKLAGICPSADTYQASSSGIGQSSTHPGVVLPSLPFDDSLATLVEAYENDVWGVDVILHSLSSPDRDQRQEQIESRFGHTFEWIFEAHLGFASWLQTDQEIFWINGKPGCGKSTMMKFIYKDPRTHELLGIRSLRSRQTTAAFFFHHRGTVLQKSFEGLLRSILGQILEARPMLLDNIRPILVQEYRQRSQRRRLSDLVSEIYNLYTEAGMSRRSVVQAVTETLLTKEIATVTLRETFAHFYSLKTDEDIKLIEHELISRWSELSRRSGSDLSKLVSEIASLARIGSEETVVFAELVGKWTDILSLRHRIHQALNDAQISPITRLTDSGIHDIESSETYREVIRRQVRTEGWTRKSLEEALSNILDQQLIDLDLCLFLDAVDEYDGWPESIALFIKRLIEPSPSSRTKIKICFSSQPWNAFVTHFSCFPGFRVHEHTEDDIRNYCRGIISSGRCTAPNLLFSMVPVITNRAQGVFLWVRLVLRDLSRVANENSSPPNNLNNLLRSTLDSLPDQLEHYYATIIKRLPAASRWDSYVLLDSIARSRSAMTLWGLLEVLECSTAATVLEGEARLRKLEKKTHHWAEERLRVLSGGLVEIVDSVTPESDPASRQNPDVQLMHQTVQEFIKDKCFKSNILGEMASTPENGHTFLSSYYLTTHGWDRLDGTELEWNARESERTTGTSQHGLFSTMTREKLLVLEVLSPIEYSARIGLDLQIRDALQGGETKALGENQEHALKGLHSSLPGSGRTAGLVDIDPELVKRAEATARVISGNGLLVDKESIMPFLDAATASGSVFHLSRREVYDVLVVVLLDNIPPLDAWDIISQQSHIHWSPPILTGWILRRHGANPNALAPDGMSTPLDFQLQFRKYWKFTNPRSLLSMMYGSSCELIRNGGVLNKTQRTDWEEFVTAVRRRGLDVSIFDEYDMPRWLGLKEPPCGDEELSRREPQTLPVTGDYKVKGSWRKKLSITLLRKHHEPKKNAGELASVEF